MRKNKSYVKVRYRSIKICFEMALVVQQLLEKSPRSFRRKSANPSVVISNH